MQAVIVVIDRPLTLVNTPWPFTSKIQLSLISGISLFFAHKVLLKTIPLYKVPIGKRRWGMLLVEYYNTIFTKLIPPWAAMRQGRLNHHAVWNILVDVHFTSLGRRTRRALHRIGPFPNLLDSLHMAISRSPRPGDLH